MHRPAQRFAQRCGVGYLGLRTPVGPTEQAREGHVDWPSLDGEQPGERQSRHRREDPQLPPARSRSLAGQLPDAHQTSAKAQRAPQQENSGVHREPPGTFERTGRLPLVAVAWMASPSLEDRVTGCGLTWRVTDLCVPGSRSRWTRALRSGVILIRSVPHACYARGCSWVTGLGGPR